MSGAQATVGEADGGASPSREEIEARATRMGWSPREKFRGPAERWVDADEFVERGERMVPLLLERNRAQDRTIQNLEAKVNEQNSTLASLVQTTRRAEQVGYKRAMREAQEKRAQAVADGDVQKFNQAEAEIQELGPEPKVEPPPKPSGDAPPSNPVVDAWIRRNPWFRVGTGVHGYAVATLDEVEKEFPGDSLEEHLAEVEARVKELFPQLFSRSPRRAAANGNGVDPDAEPEPPPAARRRSSAAMVEGSNAAPPRRPGPRSFEAMPAEVRREFDRQVKMLEGKGEPFTKEEFARYYWEAEGEA